MKVRKKKTPEEKKTPEGEKTETCPSSVPAAPEKKIKQKAPIRPITQVADSSPSKQGTNFCFSVPLNFSHSS